MATVVAMPKLGFDMAEGTLVRWVKREGDDVARGDVLAEIETDKATVEVEASEPGVLRALLVAENTSVPIGTPIAVLGTADEAIDVAALGTQAGAGPAPAVEPRAEGSRASEEDGSQPVPAPVPDSGDRVLASPVARRMAADRGLDLRALAGTGPGGRVTKRDIESATPASVGAMPSLASSRASAPPLRSERVPMTKLRSAIARRMQSSKQQAPHFYVTIEVDAERLMDMRGELNEILPDDEKLSVNDFIVKAAALSLRQFPSLNASLDGEAIQRHGQVHIGVAVATDAGLLTVVARDADSRSMTELSNDIRQIIGRARQGRVRPDDIEGATFTVSNLGMYDVDHFIAIVNPPEAAILAVGSVRTVPVVRDGNLAVGRRLKITLSADHRLTDGAEGARFLQSLRLLLEHPVRLMV
jgi:pyruvate dehydrogenase E2 component (dihydrolipoamide acetyltransferase)